MTVDEESVPQASDDGDFCAKLEEACGCKVPECLQATVLNVIEDHCKSCISPIPIDLVSLAALPADFKKLFSKLMNHVYGLKYNSQELVLKVLREFDVYEGSSDHGIPYPDMGNVSANVTVVPEMHDPEVLHVFLVCVILLLYFLFLFKLCFDFLYCAGYC